MSENKENKRNTKFETLDLGINRDYAKKFVAMPSNSLHNFVLQEILKAEDIIGKDLMEWEEIDIIQFLKLFNSVSPVALNSRMNVLRHFGNYIAKEKRVSEREFTIGDNSFLECVDMKRLLSLTLDYEQYCHIKNQLSYEKNGINVNVRDKLIFELAWQGLSVEQIQMLKESDIEFIDGEYGWQIAVLKCDDKIIRIEEPEIVDDIKDAMKECKYVVSSKDGRTKFMDYKDSEYLLKPIQVGRGKKDAYIANPTLTLQGVFRSVANPVLCDGIDLDNLTIEDIRRSKLIYLLSEQNSQYFDMDLITVLFDMKVESGLYWLKKIAKIKYA